MTGLRILAGALGSLAFVLGILAVFDAREVSAGLLIGGAILLAGAVISEAIAAGRK